MAPSSAAVIIHPLVNSTVRRGGQGQQVSDEVVAGAGPVDADQELAPEPGRDLPQGRGQHLLMVGEGV
jgi:hypothetical protein